MAAAARASTMSAKSATEWRHSVTASADSTVSASANTTISATEATARRSIEASELVPES